MSLREVADNLGISIVAVKSRLQQARKELREQLLQVYPEMVQVLPREQKRRNIMKVTVAEVIQKEPSSLAILVDESGKRALPVWIGYWEGQAIISVRQNLVLPGSQTFNFMASLLQESGSSLDEVRIETLKEDTLYAVAKIRRSSATVQEIEARPGDALALAVYTSSPLSVADEIMDKLGLNVSLQNGKFTQQDLDAIVRQVTALQPRRPGSELTTSGIGYSSHKGPRNLNGVEDMVGWIAAGNANQNYEYGVDRALQRSGEGSFYIKSKISETGGFGALLQMIAADEYRGKKVRFLGVAKCEALQGRARMCLYAYGANGVLNQDFSPSEMLAGTRGWLPFEVALQVP